MKQANPSDLYEVRPISLLGGLDLNYLIDLYEPLMGAKALAAYLTLTREKEGAMLQHDDLFLRAGLSAGEWFAALQALEAVGLVRTFTKPGKNFTGFVYCLYAPKTPGQFFDNALFAGTLRKTIGKERCEALASKYATMKAPNDYEECTEQFATYFAPDFTDPTYLESVLSTGGRLSGTAQTGFDRNVFFDSLRKLNNMFNSSSFSDEELMKIERIATLYSYNESTMADFVNDHYDFFSRPGSRFDYDAVVADCEKSLPLAYLHKGAEQKKSVVDMNSPLADGLKPMENLSPAEFLRLLQHGNKPAPADLDLLKELTVDMGLPNSVTNALVLYVLKNNNNILSKKLTEKIGASLVRAGLATSLDTLNYLDATSKSKKTVKSYEKPVSSPAAKSNKPADEAPMSDEDFKNMMAHLYDGIK
jgi:replication initiation and membrane attachment protein